MADIFDDLSAKDGYHVLLTENSFHSSLSCVAYAGGELYVPEGIAPDDAVLDILTYESPTPAQRGAVVRLHLALDAIARFLTTGGEWEQLESAARQMRRRASGNLTFPGYHLVDSYSTTDGGTYQHIFAKDDGSGAAILWEEPRYNSAGGLIGGFIDRTTLEKIRQEEDDDGWREIEAAVAEEGETAQDPDLLQLRDFEDLGTAEDSANGHPG